MYITNRVTPFIIFTYSIADILLPMSMLGLNLAISGK
jgi:hypothetical protein